MPSRSVFRCQFCGAVPPDPVTQEELEEQILELRHGEYVDAGPARWLVWHGRGLYGPHRYACSEHRGDLRDFLRRHYGTVGPHPFARVLGDVAPEAAWRIEAAPASKRKASRATLWRARGLPPYPGRG